MRTVQQAQQRQIMGSYDDSSPVFDDLIGQIMKCVDLVQRVEMIGRFIKEPERRIFEFQTEQNNALPLSSR